MVNYTGKCGDRFEYLICRYIIIGLLYIWKFHLSEEIFALITLDQMLHWLLAKADYWKHYCIAGRLYKL